MCRPPEETLKCQSCAALKSSCVVVGNGGGQHQSFHSSAAMADLILPLDQSQRHFGGYVEAMVRRVIRQHYSSSSFQHPNTAIYYDFPKYEAASTAVRCTSVVGSCKQRLAVRNRQEQLCLIDICDTECSSSLYLARRPT